MCGAKRFILCDSNTFYTNFSEGKEGKVYIGLVYIGLAFSFYDDIGFVSVGKRETVHIIDNSIFSLTFHNFLKRDREKFFFLKISKLSINFLQIVERKMVYILERQNFSLKLHALCLAS